MIGKNWILTWLFFLAAFALRAQVGDSVQTPVTAKPELLKTNADSSLISPSGSAVKSAAKDSILRRNEKTILNPQKEKQDNNMYYKLNYAGHHLHRAGRNAIAVGGILVSSVAAVLLFNTVFKPKVSDDYIPINFLYSGLAVSFILCSTKGGYHLVKAGKALKDPRFFKQDKTIYDL